MARTVFRGGIHPPDRKDLVKSFPIERAPLPAHLMVPMSQHLGAPCVPLVAVGDRVERGQLIGDVDAFISAPIHAPASGTVTDIRSVLLGSGARSSAVVIEPDPEQDYDAFVKLPIELKTADTVKAAGIVGMGGAAFPSKVKLSPPADVTIDTVILNGCECEPYLACDHRMMVEHPGLVMSGAQLIRDAIGAKRVVIAIEDNKPEALEMLRAEADGAVEIVAVPTRYPQGAEKQLIYAILGREVPHGKLPAHAGALVHNVGTAAAIAEAVSRRKPLIERVVTVTGAVKNPGNYLTLLGTPVSVLLEAAGGFDGEPGRVIMGGPMTGMALASLDVPVVKGTSGIVVLRPDETAPAVQDDQPCIRCGRCARVCPMALLPYQIGIYANINDLDGAERFHAMDCIECGCCSFICPTRRPLVQLIRRSKHGLMERGKRQ
ncbi:MAG: electron transport complex subunit RsxC [Coriobacteriia bacterium]